MSSIKAVLFLSTPHRGTDHAKTLNRVLKSSILHEPKTYVKELCRNSATIEELNESFRHHASKLRIFSFYETLATTVGFRDIMILEKDSSTIGYENETQKPLVADHHGVCKFSNTDDPNYKSVRDALRSVVSLLGPAKPSDGGAAKDLEVLQKWLGVHGPPEDDLSALLSVRKAGTCEHILSLPEFEAWLRSDSPCILWGHAPPGSGKSVQSAFVVDYLRNVKGARPAYWFFRAGDEHKQSIANMLRSIAYQTAAEAADIRRALVERAKLGTQVNKADAATVWRELFAPRLAVINSHMYWVFDGLDESESTKSFIDLLSNIGSVPNTGIRIIVFSQPLPYIIQAIERAKKLVDVTTISLADNVEDIRLVAKDEMEYFMASDEFKQEIIDEVTSRSQGNFLWACLALKKIVRCHHPEDVKRVLQSTPDGMDKMYNRMADDIMALEYEKDKGLCKILLSWATYASRPVTINELREPYGAKLETAMDLEHAITEICGKFVILDTKNQVLLVHHTARKYLQNTKRLPFSLDAHEVHEQLLVQCLNALSDPSVRAKARQQQRRTPSFLDYASASWPFHLDRSSAESDGVLESLARFFDNHFPLPWIQFLAATDQLSVLVAVSSSLTRFVCKRRKLDALKQPPLHREPELSLLKTWAVDLLNITAKFGSRLASDPEAIYKHIPPLCPKRSILHQKHAKKTTVSVSVSGLSNAEWDDCLARVSISNSSARALHVAVTPQHLAVADDSPDGKIQLWDNVIFQETSAFRTYEPICGIRFSPSGLLLACYGLGNTHVWRIADGSTVTKVPNPHRERAMALEFATDEASLIIATDLRRVHRLDLDRSEWSSYNDSLLKEATIPKDTHISSPSSVAFSPDCTQLAVAYRNYPLTVWSLDPPEVVARCMRKERQGRTMNSTMWTGVNRVVWHPFSGEILGIYRDGNIFKWGPMDGSHEEVKQELDGTPSEIRCSRSGLVFATSDVGGTVKIYDYARMVPIYKLTSDNIINDVAFSPDSRRFYDLRGSNCNVWEPSCLIRLVDQGIDPSLDDSDSMTGSDRERKDSSSSGVLSASLSFPAFEVHSESKPAVTAVETCAASQRFFAYAREDGTVAIQDTQAERSHIIAEPISGIPITHLSMSRTGECVAFATLICRVTAQRIDWPSEPGGAVLARVTFSKNPVGCGPIRQILVDTAAEKVFVCGSDKLQVLDVATGAVLAERTVRPAEQSAKWANHPDDPGTLLAFSNEAVYASSWASLEPRAEHVLDLSAVAVELLDSLQMEWLLPSYRSQMALAVTSFKKNNATFSNFLVLDMSALCGNTSNSSSPGSSVPGPPAAVTALRVPPVVADRILQPVGILPDGQLVYFDKDMYMCTAQLRLASSALAARPLAESATARHFFIPREWLTSSDLMLCRALADGTFLCPSKGDVAVIKSDIGTGW